MSALTWPIELSVERLRTRARWAGAALSLSWVIPLEVVGRRPYFVWQLLGDLGPAQAVAALAPVLAGIAILAFTLVPLRTQRLLAAILLTLLAMLVAVSGGADGAPWDLVPVPESWTHAAALPIFGIALATAVLVRCVDGDLGREDRWMACASAGLVALYLLWPVLGEAPLATVIRVSAQCWAWPGWRNRVAGVLLCLFLCVPAWFSALAVRVSAWSSDPRSRSHRSLRAAPLSWLGLSGFGAVLLAVLYRSLSGLESAIGLAKMVGSVAILSAVVILVAESARLSIVSNRGVFGSLLGIPGRREAMHGLLGVASLFAIGSVQHLLLCPSSEEAEWRLGAPNAEADRLFGSLLPRWNDDRALRDFYGKKEPDPARSAAAMVDCARAVDADLGRALGAVAWADEIAFLPSRRWDRLIAEVNAATRRAELPYLLDPTMEVRESEAARQRWFRLDTYRIEQVHHFEERGKKLTTLRVRLMAPERGGPVTLGLSRDEQPYAIVVLDEIDAYLRYLQHFARETLPAADGVDPAVVTDEQAARDRLLASDEQVASDRQSASEIPVRCFDGFIPPAFASASELCGALLGRMLAKRDVRADLIEAVERHELQHQLDGPALLRSALVRRRLGPVARDIQARVDREISAYLAQVAIAPDLTLIRLLQLTRLHHGSVDRQAALLVLEALTGHSVRTDDAAAGAFVGLTALSEDELRSKSVAAHGVLYGGDLPVRFVRVSLP